MGSVEFREVVLCDFEFRVVDGGTHEPWCLVAQELCSGRVHRLGPTELRETRTPPYPTDPDVLFVAFNASAELGCHLALGWPMPENILDLYVEHRLQWNGIGPPAGFGLLGALAANGLPGISEVEKEGMRALAMRGAPFTAEEIRDLLAYCETDVVALRRLLPAMKPRLDLPRALLRGYHMRSIARMERTGVPIDRERLNLLRARWGPLLGELVRSVDADFGVYEGQSFVTKRFESFLHARSIAWPRHDTGHLDLRDETFKQMALAHPELRTLRELRKTMAQTRLEALSVGPDGRNRTPLWPFGTKTGRNTPSNSRQVFGTAAWLRWLVTPPPGKALAYIDFEQQEFGIAAALSGDVNMSEAYRSGDAYLAFARQVGIVPASATKATHGTERELSKKLLLAIQYGMGLASLAGHLGQSIAHAHELVRLHRAAYPVLWRWSDAAVDHATLFGMLHTVFGWTLRGDQRVPTLRNYLMQANGAEVLRLACDHAHAAGITICLPVHDAILIEADAPDINDAVERTRRAMATASSDVLSGFQLRTEVKVVTHPERFAEPRGRDMWHRVSNLLGVEP